MALSEVYVSVPMPETLAVRLRSLADRECSSVAATARRLIALGMAGEPVVHARRAPRGASREATGDVPV